MSKNANTQKMRPKMDKNADFGRTPWWNGVNAILLERASQCGPEIHLDQRKPTAICQVIKRTAKIFILCRVFERFSVAFRLYGQK